MEKCIELLAVRQAIASIQKIVERRKLRKNDWRSIEMF